MVDIESTMGLEEYTASRHDREMPGQAFTVAPKTRPYDKPSHFSSVEETLDVMFRRLTQPRAASQLLALADSGIELDIIIATLVQSMFGEGEINSNMVFLMVPPLTVMLMRMVEAAGIEPKFSSDENKIDTPEILYKLKSANVSGKQISKATEAAKKSTDQLSNMPKKMGLMKRPEGVV